MDCVGLIVLVVVNVAVRLPCVEEAVIEGVNTIGEAEGFSVVVVDSSGVLDWRIFLVGVLELAGVAV